MPKKGKRHLVPGWGCKVDEFGVPNTGQECHLSHSHPRIFFQIQNSLSTEKIHAAQQIGVPPKFAIAKEFSISPRRIIEHSYELSAVLQCQHMQDPVHMSTSVVYRALRLTYVLCIPLFYDITLKQEGKLIFSFFLVLNRSPSTIWFQDIDIKVKYFFNLVLE